MEFTNTFTVPTGIDEAFSILTDLARVAPCLPGATVDSVDGDVYSGNLKAKIGPMTMNFAGTAELTERDATAHTARIRGIGREGRGAGTASADVRASLTDLDGETEVTVITDLNITGKAGQFGRGVLGDVGSKVIERFAENLRVMLATQHEQAASLGDDGAAGSSSVVDAGAQALADGASDNEALDLLGFAGRATALRMIPLVLFVVVAAILVWWILS